MTSTRHRRCYRETNCGKWHLITLQEASDYVGHAILHERFYVTHFAGCAVLFNKDTFHSNVDIARSFCRRRTWLGFTRCCVTCFLSACCSQWPNSLHCFIITHQQCLRQGKRYCQEIHPDRSCSYGSAWRCRSRYNISTIDEVFSDCALPTPPATPQLWGPGSIPHNWADVCGFLNLPGSQRFWRVTKYGAFSIPRQALGLRASDQSCHHETFLYLHFVDWSNQWNHQARYNGNIRLKERPQKRHISEIWSDHSLSS